MYLLDITCMHKWIVPTLVVWLIIAVLVLSNLPITLLVIISMTCFIVLNTHEWEDVVETAQCSAFCALCDGMPHWQSKIEQALSCCAIECMPNGEFGTASRRADSSMTIQILSSCTVKDWILLACWGGRCGWLLGMSAVHACPCAAAQVVHCAGFFWAQASSL